MAAATALLAIAGPASAVTMVFNVTVDAAETCDFAACSADPTFTPYSTQVSWEWSPGFFDETVTGSAGFRLLKADGAAVVAPLTAGLLAASGLSAADLAGSMAVGNFFALPGSFVTSRSQAVAQLFGFGVENAPDGSPSLQQAYSMRIFSDTNALATPDGPYDLADVTELLQALDLHFEEVGGRIVLASDPDTGAPIGDAGALLLRRSGVAAFDHFVSSAPEPAAWALMIVGFGLAGATLRERRSLAIVT